MMKSATSRFSLAVLLSLAVHSAIVMMWPDSNIELPQAGGQAMTVSLVVLSSKESPAPAPTPAIIPAAKPKRSTANKAPVLVVKPLALLPKSRTPKSPTTRTATAKIEKKPILQTTENIDSTAKVEQAKLQTAAAENTRTQLKSVLRKAFNTHFYYPRLAIRRGWSGEVHLSLRIEADGKLSHVRILKGSGFDLLDTAAMNSLDKVNILPTAMALLNGNSLDLILPVEYRLL